jgi:predicted ester cyclase
MERDEEILARVREQLSRKPDGDEHEAIRALWIDHSKAERAGDVGGLIRTLTPDCVYEVIPTGERWDGHAGARTFYTSMFTAFPDADISATDLVIGPQGVMMGGHMTGTHLGTWAGVEPSGKRIDVHFVAQFPWDREAQLFTGERLWFADTRGLPGGLEAAGAG